MPFSQKQKQIMLWWTPLSPHRDKAMIVLEGSVRCGKTLLASVSFVMWAMDNFNNKNFIIAGKTIGSCRRNIIRPLKHALESEEGFKIEDKRSTAEGEHLAITYNNRTNYFWVFGGKDAGSAALVQGLTAAGFLADEAILQPIDFLEQCRARLSVEGSKTWLTFNPTTERDKFYQEFLNLLDPDSYLYIHMTMADNPSISAAKLEEYRKMWPKDSIFYKRYFLGLRCNAEGLVFSFFSADPKNGYVVKEVPELFKSYYISIDYGTVNPFCAVLWGTSGGVTYALAEYYWDSQKEKLQKTNAEYIDEVAKLLNYNGKKIVPTKILVDPSASSFILELRRSSTKYRNIQNVAKADNEVLAGIQDITSLMVSGKLKISEKCPFLIDSIANLLWDEKLVAKGKDMYIKGSSMAPDHMVDLCRYMCRELTRIPPPISPPRG